MLRRASTVVAFLVCLIITTAFALLASTTMAFAQDKQFGTWWVRFESSDMDGKLAACGLDFGALTKETFREGEAAVVVRGIIFVQLLNDTTSVGLKIGTSRLAGRGDKVTDVPVRPHAAWLRTPGGRDFRSHVVATRPDEAPNEIFVVMRADEALGRGIREALLAGRLLIAYTRGAGAPVQVLALELDVAASDRSGNRTRSRKAIDDYLKCNEALMRS